MPTDIGERLRAEVARRADHRCEYCLIREDDTGFAHQVDHIVSRKHGGSSSADNLALACVLCNRHKGSDLASICASFEPITEVGNVTLRLLRLNTAESLCERRLLQAVGSYPR